VGLTSKEPMATVQTVTMKKRRMWVFRLKTTWRKSLRDVLVVASVSIPNPPAHPNEDTILKTTAGDHAKFTDKSWHMSVMCLFCSSASIGKTLLVLLSSINIFGMILIWYSVIPPTECRDDDDNDLDNYAFARRYHC
jgi:hypothetical protein